jgi:ligand-binding SRPBCC domain-containing protein
MNIKICTRLSYSLVKIQIHFNESLFAALKPPLMPMEVQRFDGMKPGDEVHVLLGSAPLAVTWVSQIVQANQSLKHFEFTDVGKKLPWPLMKWHHHHLVEEVSPTCCDIKDHITYHTGSTSLDLLLYAPMWLMFNYRRIQYPEYFKKISS